MVSNTTQGIMPARYYSYDVENTAASSTFVSGNTAERAKNVRISKYKAQIGCPS